MSLFLLSIKALQKQLSTITTETLSMLINSVITPTSEILKNTTLNQFILSLHNCLQSFHSKESSLFSSDSLLKFTTCLHNIKSSLASGGNISLNTAELMTSPVLNSSNTLAKQKHFFHSDIDKSSVNHGDKLTNNQSNQSSLQSLSQVLLTIVQVFESVISSFIVSSDQCISNHITYYSNITANILLHSIKSSSLPVQSVGEYTLSHVML